MIGDSFESDITGAHNVGWHSIWINRRRRVAKDKNIVPDYTVYSEKEIIDTLKQIITPKFDGVSVVFGDELPIKNIENACFISTRYYAGSAISGTLAVICPQTVDYQRLFLAMEYFAELLTQSITGTERK